MKDLISRQAAIDLLKQMRKDGDMIPWEGKDVFARIRKLPSAQPELTQNLHRTCTDAISRQDAIDAVMKYGKQIPTFAIAVKDALENLPSAQPERKTGKWLRSGNCIFPYECDKCGDTNERATPFCPNCGADMREGDSE